jgi:hypothetical protein
MTGLPTLGWGELAVDDDRMQAVIGSRPSSAWSTCTPSGTYLLQYRNDVTGRISYLAWTAI